MAKFIKIFCAVVCSFAALFISIGYATITGTLTITGTATVEYPPIWIANVEVVGTGTGTLEQAASSQTLLTSTVALTQDRNSSVLLAVTMKNRSTDVYGYSSTIRPAGINEATYSNGDITYAVYADQACRTALSKKTELKPLTEDADGLTFYVKFYYTDSASIDTGGEQLVSALNFQFLTPISSIPDNEGVTAVTGALAQFAEVLNDQTSFNTLTTEIMENYDNSRAWTGTFIGNVTGSQSEDTQTLDNLFSGKLSLNIDGVDTKLTAIVKWQDEDNNANTGQSYSYTYVDENGKEGNTVSFVGCEMTLYMTTSDCQGSRASPVYAVVFTKDSADGEWYQLGDMYVGSAEVVGYFGVSSGNVGSFNTDNWTSTTAYYNLRAGSEIDDIVTRAAYTWTALRAQINAAKNLDQSAYTAGSWQVLTRALAAAEAANGNTTISQAKVVTITRNLEKAIAGLVSQVQ